MPQPAGLVTAEEFEHWPDDGRQLELVQGRVVVVAMSPPQYVHGRLQVHLGRLLLQHAEARDLGAVVTETGFTLARNPDTVRAPDVAFIRKDRVAAVGFRHGYWQGPPDLAVEILSPGDRSGEIAGKVDDYLTLGVPLVWVVDPDERSVTTYRRWSVPRRLEQDDALDGEDVLPGFSCPIPAIFRVLELA